MKRLNILFGGNGVGKTTFLNAIRDNKVSFETDNNQEVLIKSYTNSIDNMKINSKDRELKTMKQVQIVYNSSSLSEGQTIIHYVLNFLQEIKDLKTDKQIVVLLDEVDSGLSVENINFLLWQIKDLIEKKNVQFFISSNHFHFVYAQKMVLNMYTGKYTKIDSYEEYFELLNNGIQVMQNSNKRKFNFLDVY